MKSGNLIAMNALISTSKRKWKFGSWLFFYEEFSGKRNNKCAQFRCNNIATLGAHVHILAKDYKSNELYIVPLCSECNNVFNDAPFVLNLSVIPVPELSENNELDDVRGLNENERIQTVLRKRKRVK